MVFKAFSLGSIYVYDGVRVNGREEHRQLRRMSRQFLVDDFQRHFFEKAIWFLWI